MRGNAMYSTFRGSFMYSVQTCPCAPRMWRASAGESSAGTGSYEYTVSRGRKPPIAIGSALVSRDW